MFPLVALALALVVVPATARAQQSELVIRVVDADSNEPLSGAQVRLSGAGVAGVTDGNGGLRLRGLAPGAREVEASYLGYAATRLSMLVPRQGTAAVSIALERRPIELEPVKVVAARSAVLSRNGFFRRRERGQGTFFTRDDITDMRPRYLSDVLRRVAGTSLTPTRTGGRASLRGTRAGCGIQYYLNGVQAPYFDVDQILPTDVEGLEVYRGAATIPPGFNRGSALCGAILIWTRAN